MKASKSLFLAFAGLGLFACSNEEVTVENGNGIKGEADVVVRLNTDSRTPVDPSTGSSLPVTGTAKVYLQTALGLQEKEINLSSPDKKATFEGVRSPGHIWVSVNGYNSTGSSTLPDITLVDANGTYAALKAPMFADGGNVSQSGGLWTLDDHTYTGTLTPSHNLARVEFAGIKHIKTENKPCAFKTITLDGLFLNNIKTNKNAVKSTTFNSWAEVTDGEQTAMPCHDAISQDFSKDDGSVTFPSGGQCYAYNIIGGDLPILTLCFSNITLTDESAIWPSEKFGYATIKTYNVKGKSIKGKEELFGLENGAVKEGQEETNFAIKKFPAGYIYQVKDLSLKDENIGTTIDGEPVTVVATVEVTPWNLVEGTVEWN